MLKFTGTAHDHHHGGSNPSPRATMRGWRNRYTPSGYESGRVDRKCVGCPTEAQAVLLDSAFVTFAESSSGENSMCRCGCNSHPLRSGMICAIRRGAPIMDKAHIKPGPGLHREVGRRASAVDRGFESPHPTMQRWSNRRTAHFRLSRQIKRRRRSES